MRLNTLSKLVLCFSLSLTAMLSPMAFAADKAVAATPAAAVTETKPALNPYETVRLATDNLINRLKQDKEKADKNPELYRVIIEDTLGHLVDFNLISKRVMAKNYKLASKEQRKSFAHTFKESLLSTYATGLSAFDDQEIVLLPFKGVKTKKTKSGKVIERAKVEMEIRTAEGDVYPVSYALYNTKTGWKVENLTLNGVNLGLTFRNQFSESLKSNKGSIDQVIASWDGKLGGIEK